VAAEEEDDGEVEVRAVALDVGLAGKTPEPQGVLPMPDARPDSKGFA